MMEVIDNLDHSSLYPSISNIFDLRTGEFTDINADDLDPDEERKELRRILTNEKA